MERSFWEQEKRRNKKKEYGKWKKTKAVIKKG